MPQKLTIKEMEKFLEKLRKARSKYAQGEIRQQFNKVADSLDVLISFLYDDVKSLLTESKAVKNLKITQHEKQMILNSRRKQVTSARRHGNLLKEFNTQKMRRLDSDAEMTFLIDIALAIVQQSDAPLNVSKNVTSETHNRLVLYLKSPEGKQSDNYKTYQRLKDLFRDLNKQLLNAQNDITDINIIYKHLTN